MFAAIEKQYLKSMIFAIYSSADFEERSLLECYACALARHGATGTECARMAES